MNTTPNANWSLSSVYGLSYFVIPDYQRDYAWTKSNVNDLLDDLIFAYRQNDDSSSEQSDHYFGTLVLEERGSVEPTDYEVYDVYGIVDGQQRLVTVAIVISAILDQMSDIQSRMEINDEFSDAIEDRKSDIRKKYIEYGEIERMKLGGLAEDASESMILGDKRPEDYLNNSDLVDAERKIAIAKRTVQNRLIEWKKEKFENGSTDFTGYYEFLNHLVKILTQRFEVNVIAVKDIDEAARTFTAIHDRGI